MQPFGRYHLLELIASGGMADVYRAEAPGEAGFVKELAIKVIRGDFRDQGDFLEMFKQEARLSSSLTHTNIVQVFDFGQVDGRYYIAMELVRGLSLNRVAQDNRLFPGELDLPKAVHIGTQVAAALSFAHRLEHDGQSMGIVHRDVSPHNVLMTYEGGVKLSDFGIARVINAVGLTKPGTIKGKPSYMAPEQARGEEIDGRADIFALAIVLWELCAGVKLFKRDNEIASLLAVCGPEPQIFPPSKHNPQVPPDLDEALLAALERDPEKRTASMQDFANQLQSVLFKIARGPNDIDLRHLMQKLKPASSATPTPAMPATLTQPADDMPLAPASEGAANRSLVMGSSLPTPDVPFARSANATVPFTQVAPDTDTEERRGTRARRETPTLALSSSRSSIDPRAGTRVTRRMAIVISGLAVVLVAVIAARYYRTEPTGASPSPTQDTGTATTSVQPIVPTPDSHSRLDPLPASNPSPHQPSPVVRQKRADTTPRLNAPKKKTTRSKHAETPSKEPATLEVTSTAWVQVSVDGKPYGNTPITLQLPAGPHLVRVERQGLLPIESTVTLSPGQTTRWSPRLRTAEP